MNQAFWHLYTSNKVKQQTTNPKLLYSAETSTEIFFRTNKYEAVSTITIKEKTKHLHKPLWSSLLHKVRDKRERFDKRDKKNLS